MKLPGKEKAYIPQEKLTKYLFSELHPVGRSKAKYFRKYGFDKKTVRIFEKALLSLLETNDVMNMVELPFGKNYKVRGKIKTPIDTTIEIVTIWFIQTGTEIPRFVTAYPV